jgi:hypothetical protein
LTLRPLSGHCRHRAIFGTESVAFDPKLSSAVHLALRILYSIPSSPSASSEPEPRLLPRIDLTDFDWSGSQSPSRPHRFLGLD